jgi:hypothetical protein
MKKSILFAFATLSIGMSVGALAQEFNETQYPIKVQLQAEVIDLALPVLVEVSGTKFVSIFKNGTVSSVVRNVAVAIVPPSGSQSLLSGGAFSFTTKCLSVDAAGRPSETRSSGYSGTLSADESGKLYGKMMAPLSNQLFSFGNSPRPKVLNLIGPDSMCRQELNISLDGMRLENRTKDNSLGAEPGLFVLSL